MLPARVVRVLPFRIDNRTISDLDNTVARTKAGLSRRFDEVHMRPVVLVMMDVVGDLTEQNSFRLQDAMRLTDEGWVRVRESVLVLFR